MSEKPASMFIPSHLLQKMVAQVSAEKPHEACGFVGGKPWRAEAVFPVQNILASPVRYHMEPKEQWQALRAIQEAGWELLAVYHSHPNGLQSPSQWDVLQWTYPDSVCLILSLHQDEWTCQGYWIDGRGAAPVKVIESRE